MKGQRPVFTAAWHGAVVERTPDLSHQGKGPPLLDLRFPNLIRLSGRLAHSDIEVYRGATLRVHRSRGIDDAVPIPKPKSILEFQPHPVRRDGSFEFYAEPKTTLKFWVWYQDPADESGQRYYTRSPARTYKKDTKGIRLDLQIRPARR